MYLFMCVVFECVWLGGRRGGTCIRTALSVVVASVALALGHGWQGEQDDNHNTARHLAYIKC